MRNYLPLMLVFVVAFFGLQFVLLRDYSSGGAIDKQQVWNPNLTDLMSHPEEGIHREYYEDGTTKAELTLNEFDERHGVCKFYHPNGELRSVNKYRYGALSGPAKNYYPDGTLMWEGRFKEDKVVGVSKSYYPNGNIKQKMDHTKGSFTEYYKNGDKDREFTRDSKGNSVTRTFYKDLGTRAMEERRYTDGTSETIYFDPEGVRYEDQERGHQSVIDVIWRQRSAESQETEDEEYYEYY